MIADGPGGSDTAAGGGERLVKIDEIPRAAMRAQLGEFVGVPARSDATLPRKILLSGMQHREGESAARIEQLARIASGRDGDPERSRMVRDLREKADGHCVS